MLYSSFPESFFYSYCILIGKSGEAAFFKVIKSYFHVTCGLDAKDSFVDGRAFDNFGKGVTILSAMLKLVPSI